MPKSYVVTLNDKTREPVMSGMCVLDKLHGQPDFMTKVWLTFSKQLQQVHIDANETVDMASGVDWAS